MVHGCCNSNTDGCFSPSESIHARSALSRAMLPSLKLQQVNINGSALWPEDSGDDEQETEGASIQTGREVQIERVSFNIFRGNIGILLGCST